MGVLRPAGHLPARVYWVRRLVVVLLAVAVVVLAVIGVKALTGSDPASGADATAGSADEQPGETTDEQPADTEEGPVACDPATLGVALAADATTYAAGALPTFTITLVNNGSDACLIDAGDTQREILITSGSDRIWSSKDCATGEALSLLVGAGQSDVRTVQWDRLRSAEGCAGERAAARSGTYQAVLTLAGIATEPVVFGLD